ncbi:hypothetical protein BURPS1710b_0143 [Burkholderia pseudomallei 1710b]|uniref:Uncharacterized protein n=1 Tax=Burkholderia pseudomallei (strain 1710b) TaxID=320372 RepID=Q3JXZ5_BURP1|nr:hypothetical protein BURPS1710b_0143 [Burkholderia pseudomallei 1710b]
MPIFDNTSINDSLASILSGEPRLSRCRIPPLRGEIHADRVEWPPRRGRRRSAAGASADARHVAAVGNCRRPRDFGRVLRLELRLGERGHARLRRHRAVRRGDVHDLHLQLHRAHDVDSARGRPVRLCAARVRPGGRLSGGRRDPCRVRVRAARDRARDRRVPARAVSRPRAEARGDGRVPRVHGAEYRRRADRRDVRARRHAARDLRAARVHGRRVAGLRLEQLREGRLGGRRSLQRRRVPWHVRGDPVRDLVLPRDRGRRDGGRGGEAPETLDSDRVRGRHPDARGARDRRDGVRGRRGRLDQAREYQRSAAAGDEVHRRREQRLDAHARVARPVRPRRVVPRDHSRLFAPDLRARPRRLPARMAREGAPALQDALSRDPRGRRGRHRRDLQRRADPVRRPDAHREHRDDVRVRRYRDVHRQHGRALQAAPRAAEDGAPVPRAAVSVLPGVRARRGARVPRHDGVLQRARRVDLRRVRRARVRLLPRDARAARGRARRRAARGVAGVRRAPEGGARPLR